MVGFEIPVLVATKSTENGFDASCPFGSLIECNKPAPSRQVRQGANKHT